MKSPSLIAVVALLAAPLLSCQNTVVDAPERGPLREAFALAGAQSGVPDDLLLAVSWVETRWHMPEGGAHDHGRHAVGLMGVVDRQDDPRLVTASSSLGIDPAVARVDAAANVAVAAEVLRRMAIEETGGIPRSINGWRAALALYGADGDPELGDSYADDVFETLATGARGTSSTGELLVLVGSGVSMGRAKIASALTADSALVDRTLDARAGFFSYGRSRAIDRVVIHTTEGSYDGAISWFRSANNPYQTSAHYVIRSSDGQITQMVDEANTAHHVLTWNSRSIGIEHEAISAQPHWFTDAMYAASAALTRDICERHGIPMDREHIVGHVEVPGNDHSDPGRHWNWDHFIQLVRTGTSTPSEPRDTFCDDGSFGGWCDGGDLVDCGPSSARGFRSRETCAAGCQVMPAGQNDRCMEPPAAAPPEPEADPCGGETYQGRCEGSTMIWCENSAVRSADCGARGLGCGWQNDDVGNNCVQVAPADPCGGETYQGRCEGNTLVWCEADAVKSAQCRNCGWQNDDVGNNCL
ncbi:MAG: peptidoglycan recognition family protein [Deltaproteobacteria bacterium]|nr:peptidoglycan recognition family protein [Deltaproteobacteria bacterium]